MDKEPEETRKPWRECDGWEKYQRRRAAGRKSFLTKVRNGTAHHRRPQRQIRAYLADFHAIHGQPGPTWPDRVHAIVEKARLFEKADERGAIVKAKMMSEEEKAALERERKGRAWATRRAKREAMGLPCEAAVVIRAFPGDAEKLRSFGADFPRAVHALLAGAALLQWSRPDGQALAVPHLPTAIPDN